MADKDLEHMYRVVDKLDTAIEKLSDVSTDIKQILAVHEQRLDQTETLMDRHFIQMEGVHSRISALRDEMNNEHQQVLEKINEINKWRWQIMGGAAVVAAVVSSIATMMPH